MSKLHPSWFTVTTTFTAGSNAQLDLKHHLLQREWFKKDLYRLPSHLHNYMPTLSDYHGLLNGSKNLPEMKDSALECVHEKNRQEVICPGFVQSLEFLKKSGNLRTPFPDLEKVWKLKAKS